MYFQHGVSNHMSLYRSELYRADLERAWKSVDDRDILHGKKVLITGATGLIGSFIIDMLLHADHTEDAAIDVWALGRNKDVLRDRFGQHIDSGHLFFIEQDIVESLKSEIKFDYIIHLAGDGYPAAFRERPVETMTPAFIGTYNLLKYALSCPNCRFLLASTGEVYGAIENRESFSENDCGHIDSMSSRSCYPIAKKAAETLLASFVSEYSVSAVVARLSHVYGPGGSLKDNRATVQFMNSGIKGEDIVLHSEGKQMRSYTYVADAVQGLMYTLLRGTAGEAYNIANMDSRITIAEFAHTVADECNVKCIFDIDGNYAESTPISYAVLDSTKLEMLGYKGLYKAGNGIRNSLQIMRYSEK